MGAVRAGVGREEAHEAIKEHAVAVALAMREGAPTNDLLDRLAADDRLGGLDRSELARLVSAPLEFTGAARDQGARIVERIAVIVQSDPAAAGYSPATIL
jgi:adenylosuccinate lyase